MERTPPSLGVPASAFQVLVEPVIELFAHMDLVLDESMGTVRWDDQPERPSEASQMLRHLERVIDGDAAVVGTVDE